MQGGKKNSKKNQEPDKGEHDLQYRICRQECCEYRDMQLQKDMQKDNFKKNWGFRAIISPAD